MKLGTYTKTPIERKRYSLDYTDWLDSTEVVNGVVFLVTPSTGISPLVVDANSIDPAGKQVVFFVNYGDTGVSYTVDVRVTTSGGQAKEDQIVFLVKDL